MRTPIQSLIRAALLGAGACALLAQTAPPRPPATTVEIREESGPKNLTSKRSAATIRSPDGKVFAFSGHPFGPENASQPVIIQTANFDAKVADQLREDMAVMARILQKVGSEHGTEPERVLGLDLVMHGGRAARNLFIDDYGVIFTINVDLPLKGVAKPDDDAKQKYPEVDAEWERARSELFGNRSSSAVRFLERSGRRYDPQEVDRLRDELIDSLRAAANIRNLKEDHWVVFVVRGLGSARALRLPEGEELYVDAGERSGESTMVIKARQRDISALAKRDMPKDEFRRQVAVSVY